MISIKIPSKIFLIKKIKKIKKLNKRVRKLSRKNKIEKIKILNKKLTSLFSKNIIKSLFKRKYKKSYLNKFNLNKFYLSEKAFKKLISYDKKVMNIRYNKIYLTNQPKVLKMDDWNIYSIDNSVKKIHIKEDNK